MTGMLSAGTDRIGTMDSRITCLIREIRPLDYAAMQAGGAALMRENLQAVGEGFLPLPADLEPEQKG